ncbi:hypothetical protein [Moorena sp. SIO1G6]|nr:hypothetical protein [Moorena sp. SIO1G6]
MAQTMTKTKVDISKFLGRWVNTYKETKGIASFEISSQDGVPKFRAFGSQTSHAPGDWGEVEIIPLAASPDGGVAKGFHITYEINQVKSLLAVNENKGLLIIAIYFLPSEGNGYFSREFFFLE